MICYGEACPPPECHLHLPSGQGVGSAAQHRAHQDSREVRRSGVLGSGLMGGEVTKAAALAQFLLQ